MNIVSKRTFNLVLAGVMIAMGTALGFGQAFRAALWRRHHPVLHAAGDVL